MQSFFCLTIFLDFSAPPPHHLIKLITIFLYIKFSQDIAPPPFSLPSRQLGLCRQGQKGAKIMRKNCLFICRNLQEKSEIFLFHYSFGFQRPPPHHLIKLITIFLYIKFSQDIAPPPLLPSIKIVRIVSPGPKGRQNHA